MTPSTMLELGTPLPAFRLPDVDGVPVASIQFQGAAGLLVTFLCPHCPFVKHVRGEWARFAAEYAQKGLSIVAINSNDSVAFPDDSPEGMKKEIAKAGYTFRYLIDETQSVAKAFHAACTPDFFLFDRNGKLVYRGQFDDSRPANSIPTTGADLRAAGCRSPGVRLREPEGQHRLQHQMEVNEPDTSPIITHITQIKSRNWRHWRLFLRLRLRLGHPFLHLSSEMRNHAKKALDQHQLSPMMHLMLFYRQDHVEAGSLRRRAARRHRDGLTQKLL